MYLSMISFFQISFLIHFTEQSLWYHCEKGDDDFAQFSFVPSSSTSNWLLLRLDVAWNRDVHLIRQGSPPSYSAGDYFRETHEQREFYGLQSYKRTLRLARLYLIKYLLFVTSWYIFQNISSYISYRLKKNDIAATS